MNNQQAKRLGAMIRARRRHLGYSIRQLAERIDVQGSTLLRLEDGRYTAPSPEKLARIAEALDLPLADLYAQADYAVPADLPSPLLYLRTKYRDLPARDLAAISRDVARAFRSRGIDPTAGPKPGEDEQTERPPRARKKRT